LNATLALQQKFAKAGDFEKFMSADNDFHQQLYAATGNQGLWDLVRSRSGHIDRLRRLHLPSPGKAGHRAPSQADRDSHRRERAR
jgi:DNA-binding GntR family transcriptional regulator